MPEDGGNEHFEHDAASGAERPRVLVFFDYACPFCYVDYHRFEGLQQEMDFDLVLVPFELRPGLEEPIDLTAEGSGHSDRVDDYLLSVAEKEGFLFAHPSSLPNTHRAIVLGEMARDRGGAIQRAVHRAIFEAYFAEGRDIDSEQVLIGIAEESGIAREDLQTAWEEAVFDERIHEFRHLALDLGLDATPAAIICNELMIGSRPAGVLREALARCDARLEASRQGVVDDGERTGDPRIRPSSGLEDTPSAPKR